MPPMTVPTKKDKTMLKKLCHDQVKILLERMDTNPEEFAIVEGKWDEFMPNRSRFNTFTKVEQYLIRQKFTKIIKNIERQETYDAILETLVFKEETKTKRYYSTSNQPVLGTPSYTVNTSEHIKLHQEVLHQAAKKLYRTSS